MKKVSLYRFDGKVISKVISIAFFIICVVNCNQRKEEDAMISIETVNKIISDSSKMQEYIILDMRSRMDYVRGHLVSSIWMPSDSLKAKKNLIPNDKKIILYDADGIESLKTVKRLQSDGFNNFYTMKDGFDSWVKQGYPAAIQLVMNTNDKLDIEKKDITVEEVYQIIKNNTDHYSIIDIRSSIAFRAAHIKHAISIPYVPLNEFVVGIEEQNYPKAKPLIIYCDQESFDIGDKAADVLLRNNYTEVYLLKDGMEEWLSRKYPIINN